MGGEWLSPQTASQPPAALPVGLVVTPESKLRPPSPQVMVVPRQRLLDRLSGARFQVLAIDAPGGFGKSTLASQFAAQSVRVAWATLDASDSDPVVLLSTLLNSLAAAGALPAQVPDDRALGGVSGDEPLFSRWVLPQFRRRIESSQPVTLVLDDVHLARGSQATAILLALVDSLPPQSVVVFVGRSLDTLPLALWEGQGRLLELRSEDLALDSDEIASTMQEIRGERMAADRVASARALTGGWPVAVSLVARYEVSEGSLRLPAQLGDYLDREVVAKLEPDLLRFLERTSPLEALSADLCHAVLDEPRADALLRHAESHWLLLTRLEGSTGWFRLHELIRHHLVSRFTVSDPAEAARVNRRAAEWYEAHGLADQAIAHAVAAGDPQLLGRLMWPPAAEALLYGQGGRPRRWLDSLDDATVARAPGLSLTAAWTAVTFADYAAATRWREVTAGLLSHQGIEESAGSGIGPGFALLVALSGEDGWAKAADMARDAHEALPAGDLMRVFADESQGFYRLLSGSEDQGLALLERARASAAAADLATTRTEAASMAALAFSLRGDAQRASELNDDAREAWRGKGNEGALTTRAILAVSSVLVLQRRGDASSDDAMATALELVDRVSPALPWYAVVAYGVAARHLAQRDNRAATQYLSLARHALSSCPPSPLLEELVSGSERVVRDAQLISVLSPAELRVWELLQGRLTLREIADRLVVSPETVKTQTSTIYRKLNVTSRREAQELGEALRADLRGTESAFPVAGP